MKYFCNSAVTHMATVRTCRFTTNNLSADGIRT